MATTPPISDAQQRFRSTLTRQLLGAALVVACVSALTILLLPGDLG